MASVTAPYVREPGWLAARRERAAVRSRGLELPRFKGTPGWEFNDLTGLDLDAFAPATGGDATAPERAEPLFELPEGASRLEQVDALVASAVEPAEASGAVVLPLSVAAERFPERVERHLGSVVTADDAFVARNESAWAGGAFVYVPRGVRLTAPVFLNVVQDSDSALNWRTLIVLDEGAEAEVWEQYVSSGPEVAGLFNAVVEISVGPAAILRYVNGQGLSERTWMFGTQRAQVERDGSLDWAALGFGSSHGRCGWRRSWPGRALTRRSPAPTRPTGASTSTTTPPRSTRRPTAHLTSPSGGCSTGAPTRSGAA